jgi:hypothetical protein
MSNISCGEACCYTLFVVPIVSAMKFVICLLPVVMMLTGGVIGISLGGIACDIGLAYWSVAVSPQLGTFAALYVRLSCEFVLGYRKKCEDIDVTYARRPYLSIADHSYGVSNPGVHAWSLSVRDI